MAALGNITAPDILEVGCGAGFSADYLHGRYKTYLGLDYSEKLIAFAKSKNRRAGADFIVADIAQHQSKTKYDAIIMIGLLHHLEEPATTLSQMIKLTKPGGLIIANEPQSGNPAISFLRWVRKKTDPSYSEDQEEYSKEELIKLAQQAGLTDIQIYPQGLFSTPFAEVLLPFQIIMMPLSKFACFLDRVLEKYLPGILSFISWNLILVAKAPKGPGHD